MARAFLRHFQPVVHNVVRPGGRWINGNAWKSVRGGPVFDGVQFDYLTTAALPTTGQITVSSGGLQVRIDETSKDGYAVDRALARAVTGWVLTIGSQSAQLAEPARDFGSYWIVPVVAWPVLADGEYTVTLRTAA